jgi:hypothetical protein
MPLSLCERRLEVAHGVGKAARHSLCYAARIERGRKENPKSAGRQAVSAGSAETAGHMCREVVREESIEKAECTQRVQMLRSMCELRGV